MSDTVQGSPDGPKYIYGKENVNWKGAQKANPDNDQLSSSDAKDDFPTTDAIPQLGNTTRELMEDYYMYPEDLSDRYLSEFITEKHDFDVDELGDFVLTKLRMIADAIKHNTYDDEKFITSLYGTKVLDKGTIEHTSKELLVDYLHNPEDLTDYYIGSFVQEDDPYDIDQLRDACYELSDTIADHIDAQYKDA